MVSVYQSELKEKHFILWGLYFTFKKVNVQMVIRLILFPLYINTFLGYLSSKYLLKIIRKIKKKHVKDSKTKQNYCT